MLRNLIACMGAQKISLLEGTSKAVNQDMLPMAQVGPPRQDTADIVQWTEYLAGHELGQAMLPLATSR